MELHLIKALRMLGQNSESAVQNGSELSALHRYLHIKRPIEKRLAEKMQAVDEEGGGLILIIGSAGDGKSHLISCMKGESGWPYCCYYNDATASSSPTKTAEETLKEALIHFDDAHLDATNRKLILAINLGKLSSFAEDEEVKVRYSRLREAILPVVDDAPEQIKEDLPKIKLVRFTNEQMFEFYPDDVINPYPVKASFFAEILRRITAKAEGNPFYAAYLKDIASGDAAVRRHPVILNYELLQLPEVQQTLEMSLIEAIVRCRLKITPREFFDFICEILVCPDIAQYKEVECFTEALLPSLLYGGGNNAICKAMVMLDPLRSNSVADDEKMAIIYTAEEMPYGFSKLAEQHSLPEEMMSLLEDRFGWDKEENARILLAQCIFRLESMLEYRANSETYTDYVFLLRDLLAGGSAARKAMEKIYKLVQQCIPRNAGSYYQRPDMVPLNIKGEKYQLFAGIEMQPKPLTLPFYAESPNKFSLEFEMAWGIAEGEGHEVRLKMDFQLFSYLKDLQSGRLAVSYENKKNLAFDRFVRELSEYSQGVKKVVIVHFNGTEQTLSKKMFGMELQ